MNSNDVKNAFKDLPPHKQRELAYRLGSLIGSVVLKRRLRKDGFSKVETNVILVVINSLTKIVFLLGEIENSNAIS